MTQRFIEIVDISKIYPGVTALEGVGVDVAPGEVVGLVGENGAGKSTLMKVLGGIVAPTRGSIIVDGVSHDRLTVKRSMASGIAFVVTLSAELLGASRGVGTLLVSYQDANQPASVYAGVVLVGFTGMILNHAFALLEGRLFRWTGPRRAARA